MHSPDGPLELRFYNGRQLSDHEQDVIEQYLKWAKTTKLGPPKV